MSAAETILISKNPTTPDWINISKICMKQSLQSEAYEWTMAIQKGWNIRQTASINEKKQSAWKPLDES